MGVLVERHCITYQLILAFLGRIRDEIPVLNEKLVFDGWRLFPISNILKMKKNSKVFRGGCSSLLKSSVWKNRDLGTFLLLL